MANFGLLALIALAAWLADKTLARFYPEPSDPRAAWKEPGCLVMVLAWAFYLVLLLALFYPSLEMLERYSCRSAANYQDCMDPPEQEF